MIRRGAAFAEHVTSRSGEATEITRKAIAKGTRCVIAVGGDGTLGEVVNGYLAVCFAGEGDDQGHPINEDVALGLLPSGTGSDFRRSLGLDSLQEAIHAIINRRTRLIDAGRCEFTNTDGQIASRYFINLASFGLGGDVVALVNGWRGRLPSWVGGRARFVAAALKALGRYRNISVAVQLDGERRVEIKSNLIVVANGRFAGGGMMLAPHARLDDGLFDVILTDGATRMDVIKELPRIGVGGLLKNPKVKEMRAREVSITSAVPIALDLDGETAGQTPARLMLLPAAVRLIS